MKKLKILTLLIVLLLTVLLGGCGTGGKGSGDGPDPDPDQPDVEVSAIQLSTDSVVMDVNESSTVTLKLVDGSGQTIYDSKSVVFSLDYPLLGSIPSPVVVTDGVASQVFTAGNTEGIVTLTASVDGAVQGLTFQIGETDTLGNAVEVKAIQLMADSTMLDVREDSTVVFRLLNGSGQTISGTKTVSFSLDKPSLASIPPSVVVTDGVGSQVLTAGDIEDVVILKVTVDGVEQKLKFQIGETAPIVGDVEVNAIQLTTDSTILDVNGTSTVSYWLVDASGQTVTASKTVVFRLNNPLLASISSPVMVVDGVGSQTFTAGNIEGRVTLVASVDGVDQELTFQITEDAPAGKVIMSAVPESITIRGTSVVSATVSDTNDVLMAEGTIVLFKVTDTSLGSVTSSASIRGGDGIALATFTAANDSGEAIIEASVGDVSETVAVSILAATPLSIEFYSADPKVVAIKGSGGTETSIVRFLISDSNGDPLLDSQMVRFTLSSGPEGGEYLGEVAGNKVSDVGSVGGYAQVILHSGISPGPVTITATVLDTDLLSSSGVVAIGGGVPSAKRFSLSTSTLNVEGLYKDNAFAEIEALIADRYGNYNILEGTAVSFYSECGAIDRHVNVDEHGEGSVEFRTQDPGPYQGGFDPTSTLHGSYLDLLGIVITPEAHPMGGLCTIVAVVNGEEEFTDTNGNALYDIGEFFVDTYDDIHQDVDDDANNIDPVVSGSPFDNFEDLIVDSNHNGVFDGFNGVWDANKSISKNINLLITGEPDLSLAIDGVPLSDQSVINLSVDDPIKITFAIHDSNYNPPVSGTSFAVSSGILRISGNSSNTFADTNNPGSPIYSIRISPNPLFGAGDSGDLVFTWTWKGSVYTSTIYVNIIP